MPAHTGCSRRPSWSRGTAATSRRCSRFGREHRHAGGAAPRRHEPQRTGPERRDPCRRPAALARRDGRGGRRPRRASAGDGAGHANRVLKPYGRRLGPDPASTDIATVGGVDREQLRRDALRHAEDSYRTLRSLTLVLPSGTVIDTAAPGAEERVRRPEPELPLVWPRSARDPGRLRGRRAHPAQVRRSRTRWATACARSSMRTRRRDLPAAAGRLRGHAGVHRRGGIRDRAAACRTDDHGRFAESRTCAAFPPGGGGARRSSAGAPGVFAAARVPGQPEYWRLPPGLRRCWSSSARRTRRTRALEKRAPDARRRQTLRGPTSRARRSCAESTGDPRGPARHRRGLRPPGPP